MTEYRNPWAGATDSPVYRHNIAPVLYAGCELYHVHPKQWDTVKGGVCIAQRGSLNAAKAAADIVADLLLPTYEDVRERQLDGIGE